MMRLLPLTATLAILIAIAAGAVAARDMWFDDSQLRLTFLEERYAGLRRSEMRRAAVGAFAESGRDPCSLPTTEAIVEYRPTYASLEALVNESHLIVRGKPLRRRVVAAEPPLDWGDVAVTLSVQEVLRGDYAGDTITVSLGAVFYQGSGRFARVVARGSVLDACTTDPLIFFLQRSLEGDLRIMLQGWASIDDDIVASPGSVLFDGYADADSLLTAIREIVGEQ